MSSSSQMIDLRSDTVTRPSDAMRHAMFLAPVGDDVYGDDPTVARLQARVAELAGKEIALFFPSGTQSNLAALLAHCQRGDEYIAGQQSHIYLNEGGGGAVLGGVQPQPLPNAIDGSIPLDSIERAVKPIDFHYARSRLLALENTIGGKVLPQGYVIEACELARRHGLVVHLDGARAFNAVVASSLSLREVCMPFDTVSLCFSKGLGAPAGTVLAGDTVFIETSRRWRKMLGGGLRQSGILAAACLYALDHHVERLQEDHENAAWLANALSRIDEVDVLTHATNMLTLQTRRLDLTDLSNFAKLHGVLMKATYGKAMRLVTHRDVDRSDLQRVVEVFQRFFQR